MNLHILGADRRLELYRHPFLVGDERGPFYFGPAAVAAALAYVNLYRSFAQAVPGPGDEYLVDALPGLKIESDARGVVIEFDRCGRLGVIQAPSSRHVAFTHAVAGVWVVLAGYFYRPAFLRIHQAVLGIVQIARRIPVLGLGGEVAPDIPTEDAAVFPGAGPLIAVKGSPGGVPFLGSPGAVRGVDSRKPAGEVVLAVRRVARNGSELSQSIILIGHRLRVGECEAYRPLALVVAPPACPRTGSPSPRPSSRIRLCSRARRA